jgi:hypothetical protein
MDRAASIAAETDCAHRPIGMTKSAVKNAKRNERRERKRAEMASTVSYYNTAEEPFTPPRTSPNGLAVQPGAPRKPPMRSLALLLLEAELKMTRASLREALCSYDRLRDACAVCTKCSAYARDLASREFYF